MTREKIAEVTFLLGYCHAIIHSCSFQLEAGGNLDSVREKLHETDLILLKRLSEIFSDEK